MVFFGTFIYVIIKSLRIEVTGGDEVSYMLLVRVMMAEVFYVERSYSGLLSGDRD